MERRTDEKASNCKEVVQAYQSLSHDEARVWNGAGMSRLREPFRMKPFNLEEAQKMTKNEMMVEVCKGLADICGLMSDDPKFSHFSSERLKQYASDFRAFARLYGTKVSTEKPEGKK